VTRSHFLPRPSLQQAPNRQPSFGAMQAACHRREMAPVSCRLPLVWSTVCPGPVLHPAQQPPGPSQAAHLMQPHPACLAWCWRKAAATCLLPQQLGHLAAVPPPVADRSPAWLLLLVHAAAQHHPLNEICAASEMPPHCCALPLLHLVPPPLNAAPAPAAPAVAVVGEGSSPAAVAGAPQTSAQSGCLSGSAPPCGE
jgi:hypothetical protein